MDALRLLSAQYCARQNATAFLELWGLLLLLCCAAVVILFVARRFKKERQFAARFCAGALFFLALLNGIFASSIFYGCSATAASEQGLGSNLAAGTYNVLRCLGTDVLSSVHAWVLVVGSSIGTVVLSLFGVYRRGAAVRAAAFVGAAFLIVLAFAFGFFLFFGFSWCASERLI